MSTVRSLDGTPIAFERTGDGPPVIIMGGALNDKMYMRPLAALLAERFTVYNYDRRGRGDSGDNPPYALQREIEDLSALVAEIDEPTAVFANCSGGVIAMEGVAAGLPITRLAMYEPPFVLEGQRAAMPTDYVRLLRQYIAEGRRGEAVRYFMGEVVRMPEPAIETIRNGPMWPWLESLAPSLPYDTAMMGDTSLPRDLMAKVTVPTLVIDGEGSPQWLRNSTQAVADLLEKGRRQTLPGQDHNLAMDLVTPILVDFFTAPGD